MEIVIGSRGSKLALWQSEWVKARLEALEPDVSVRIEIIKTMGDVRLDVPLSTIGGQGAFTKELEVALLDRRVDVAVHSLKDLPTVIPEGLAITATPERDDPRDALVLRAGAVSENASLRNLATGAVVGTSSLRRIAQLKHLRPDVQVKDLRGNVDTRLRKLDSGDYDALILASAGLRRLGLRERISAAIDPEEMLPAVGQGALGIETRSDDEETIALVSRLDNRADARRRPRRARAFAQSRRRLSGAHRSARDRRGRPPEPRRARRHARWRGGSARPHRRGRSRRGRFGRRTGGEDDRTRRGASSFELGGSPTVREGVSLSVERTAEVETPSLTVGLPQRR